MHQEIGALGLSSTDAKKFKSMAAETNKLLVNLRRQLTADSVVVTTRERMLHEAMREELIDRDANAARVTERQRLASEKGEGIATMAQRIPGKADGARKRKMPPWPHEEDTLTEKSTRSVVEQYLKQRPERLGDLLRRLDPRQRTAAVASIRPTDILKMTVPYADASRGNTLNNDDTIAVLNFHDSSDDSDYAILRVGTINDEVRDVLDRWYRSWLRTYDTASKRSGKIEHDGSAQMCLDSDMDTLTDAIETVVEELREAAEAEAEGEEEDGDEYDSDAKFESLQEETRQFFEDCGWVKLEAGETRPLFMLAPKITIRYMVN